MSDSPTIGQYGGLQDVFDVFNTRLFDGALPACLITMQRKKSSMGYFSHGRFISDDGELTDEIALNPVYFRTAGTLEALQTLAHEMAHLWQAHYGKPSRKTYHNKEWGQKMEEIGLMPSDTGREGGKKTGQKMAEYVIEGGPFEALANEILGQGFRLWSDRFDDKGADLAQGSGDGDQEGEGAGDGEGVQPDPRKKVKYSHECAEAGSTLNVWGKPGLPGLVCGACGGQYGIAL